MKNRNIFLYWIGKEYSLIKILRNLIYLHSDNGKGYNVHLITNKNINKYIKNIPKYFNTLKPAHQADFIRVHVICDNGGIWLDSDTLVLDKLDSLFDLIEIHDGFFIKENNICLWNGIFGSKKQTKLMQVWKNQLTNILNKKENTISWSEIGPHLLRAIYNNDESLYNNYKIFNGLDNMYPIDWRIYVNEIIEKPYDNYKNIIKEYQPVLALVNSVYKKLEYKTEKEILDSNMPINYFINKSFSRYGIQINKIHNNNIIYNYGEKDYISNALIKYRTWEPNITNLFYNILENNISENTCIIDIGCNIGYYSIITANHNQNIKVYSIDANSSNINMLSLSCKHNSLYNITLINKCISDKIGFYKSSNKEFAYKVGNIGGLAFEESKYNSDIISTTIDNIISENNINNVVIMKIDIEGYELFSLKGATNTLKTNIIKNIIIEITPKFNNDSIQILNILKDNNYKLYNIPHQETGVLTKNNYYLQHITNNEIIDNIKFLNTIKIQTNILAIKNI